jgi:hypothetical protein
LIASSVIAGLNSVSHLQQNRFLFSFSHPSWKQAVVLPGKTPSSMVLQLNLTDELVCSDKRFVDENFEEDICTSESLFEPFSSFSSHPPSPHALPSS